MGLSLKYQVAIRLCCLVFLLWADCRDLIRGPMILDPHGACPRMHPTSSDFIPWWTVYPSRWFLRCVNANYVAHTCHRGWQGRGDLGKGSCINEVFLFWNWLCFNKHTCRNWLTWFITLQRVAVRKMKVKLLHLLHYCVLIRTPRNNKLRTLLSLESHLRAFKRMHFAAVSKDRPTQSVVCWDANETQIGVHCDPKMHSF